MSTVLITTANNPPHSVPHLALTNVALRVVSAQAAALMWASMGIRNLVIADATGSTLLDRDQLFWLKELGIDVEQLAYNQDRDLIVRMGKGRGEGLLLEYALNNSRILSSVDNFFKCTGKVYCRNFASIVDLIQQRGIKNWYWRHFDPGAGMDATWADTRFFYTQVSFARSVIVPAYLNADDYKIAAEHCCYNVLESNLPRVNSLRSRLSGLAGGSGLMYSEADLGYLDSSYPCWIN